MTSTTANPVLVARDGRVATVTLNRPEKLNAVTPQMQSRYVEALRGLDAESDVRAIVVTGAGRGFCSGADLSALTAGPEALRGYAPTLEDLPTVALDLRKPVVAAVNGPVAGIGFALMLACDVRFVAEDATLSTTFARLGLVAEYGLAWLLPRVVGTARAAEILLSGRTLTAQEAARIGLAHEVTPAGQALTRAAEWAHDVAGHCSPRSLAVMKQQIYADPDLPRDAALQRAIDLMLQSFTWPDLAEAMRARAEKRAPRFPPR
jgi:enoyl-CoA hydratase/carnithine racemase